MPSLGHNELMHYLYCICQYHGCLISWLCKEPGHWQYRSTIKSLYKTHFSRLLNCWSLRCSWSIACRRCSNYIFILQWTLGFNIWTKITTSRDEKRLNFGIWHVLYQRLYSSYPTIFQFQHQVLTHCGLVTPYDDKDLSQLWLKEWLGAW